MIAVDGTTGVYLFTLVQPATELAKVIGIALTPTVDFLVAAQSFTSASHVTFTPSFPSPPPKKFFLRMFNIFMYSDIYIRQDHRKKERVVLRRYASERLPSRRSSMVCFPYLIDVTSYSLAQGSLPGGSSDKFKH